LEKFTDKIASLKVGDPMDPNTGWTLSSEEALIDILDQVERFEKQVPKF
jgi:succinate-semialdehyde dehydrogenase/glutarate-semialdehyde dehydrogenase